MNELKKRFEERFGLVGSEPCIFSGDYEQLKENGYFVGDRAKEIWDFFLPYLKGGKE